MGCQVLLSRTGTIYLLASSGRSCFHYRVSSWPSAQMSGQTEAANKWLENYLRSFTSDRPKDWSRWVELAEWSFNSSIHAYTKVSPFETLYGDKPPRLLNYMAGTSRLEEVDSKLRDRDHPWTLHKGNITNAHNRMKHYSDHKRKEHQYSMGDWVYLQLQPHRQSSVHNRRNLKPPPLL
ncbi:hypothetical protein CIPAW_06G103000 [Carya illinoinensis]|uniref:Integrase catalytic domain-containing protein n=1 Tax=Carya illinoinensis TaxID=32201 RepID=A0A8T1QAD4_CARIL|nr:hypothetical protein CIPAW_06G103000 [Carya illinoinensis]